MPDARRIVIVAEYHPFRDAAGQSDETRARRVRFEVWYRMAAGVPTVLRFEPLEAWCWDHPTGKTHHWVARSDGSMSAYQLEHLRLELKREYSAEPNMRAAIQSAIAQDAARRIVRKQSLPKPSDN